MQEDALGQPNWWGLQAIAWRTWHLTTQLGYSRLIRNAVFFKISVKNRQAARRASPQTKLRSPLYDVVLLVSTAFLPFVNKYYTGSRLNLITVVVEQTGWRKVPNNGAKLLTANWHQKDRSYWQPQILVDTNPLHRSKPSNALRARIHVLSVVPILLPILFAYYKSF